MPIESKTTKYATGDKVNIQDLPPEIANAIYGEPLMSEISKSKTTNNVIELDKWRKKYGDVDFMLCQCQQYGDVVTNGVLPIVMHDKQGPFICALVCPNCENEIAVSFGRPYVNKN